VLISASLEMPAAPDRFDEMSSPQLPPPILLRPATLADAPFVYAIRNDPQTRAASLNADELSYEDHYKWFKTSLTNPKRRLFIAEANGVAIGSGRMDFGSEGITLSWTLAPEQRGRGFGHALVGALAALEPGRLIALIRSENQPSRRVAEAAGFRLVGEKKGVCLHIRDAL
jgi:RimJ/RimL family protein N-acetyltransferase